MYKGHVYLKENGKPLRGVRVSDGLNVVFTDENGAFALEGWERAAVISVNVLTTSHDDWYYNIDSHTGDFDFYITPANSAEEHSFLHISDSEVGESGCISWMDFMKKTVQEEKADFVIHTGDICAEKGLYKHREDMNFETLGVPVRYTLGNHDFWDGEYGQKLYETLYGPICYSFDLGNIHYVALPIKLGQRRSGYKREDSDLWLKNDLATLERGKRVIVFSHDLCEDDEEGFVLRDTFPPIDLKTHGLLAWVFGHYHVNWLNEKYGIFNINTARPDVGGVDSSPAAIRKVSITAENKLNSKLIFNDLSLVENGDEYVWRTNIGGNILFSVPIEKNGKIFVGTMDDGYPKNCGVYCIDAASGDVLWKFATENSVKNVMEFYEDLLYVQDTYGIVYCLTESGELLWKRQTVTERPHYTAHGVLVRDGVVYAASGMQANAVDAKTGEILWTSYRVERDWTRFLCDSAAKFILENGVLYYGTHWSRFFAVDAKTGETLWENRDVAHLNSTPAVFGENIIVPTYDSLAKINLKTGETISKIKVSPFNNFNSAGEPVIYNGEIYFPTVNNGIAVINPETLEFVRKYDCCAGIVPVAPYCGRGYHSCDSKPLIKDDALIFTASGGRIYFYNLQTNELIKEINIGTPSYTTPLVLGDKIVVADFCGNLTAYKL